MSEYWKSTPKYWCKYCSVYVRETNLERANHESTARHQSAVKRSLRDLHRSHEQEGREKERARREVERLNGVVSGSGSSSGAASGSNPNSRGGISSSTGAQPVTQTQRQTQLEQLAQLGVDIPDEYRSSLALAGEWTVTSTRVVRDPANDGEDGHENVEDGGAGARTKGVRKREDEETEEQKEANAAIGGLFKKQKTWGGRKAMLQADEELDALLSAGLAKKERAEKEPEIKKEDTEGEPIESTPGDIPPGSLQIKPDPDGVEEKPVQGIPDPSGEPGPAVPPIVFKKRKPKAVRQK